MTWGVFGKGFVRVMVVLGEGILFSSGLGEARNNIVGTSSDDCF